MEKEKKQKHHLKNLILSGGSAKGLSYIGVLKALEERNLIQGLENIACASVGSLIGLFIVLGYSSQDLIKLLLKIDLGLLSRINSDSILNLVNHFGLDDGLNLELIISILIENKIPNKKGFDVTFLDLWNYNKINLTITGSRLYLGYMEEVYYNYLKTPNQSVSKAIRISTSIPPVFKPLIEVDHHLLDGGIVNNYPIDLFSDQIESTLGVLCLTKYDKRRCQDIYEIYSSIIYYLAAQSSLSKRNLYKNNTVVIESDINSFEVFSIDDETKTALINLGYQLTRQFLDFKDFEPVAKKNPIYPDPNLNQVIDRILICLNRTPIHKN